MRWRRERGLVLTYHRVARLARDPQLLAVSPEHFAAHLDVLHATCEPMPLGEMLRKARAGRLPRRAVAVTFDDGYADTADEACRLLGDRGTPATVFVVASCLGATREFWWDNLERMLLVQGRTPDVLTLRIGSTVHEWTMGNGSRDAGREPDEGWRVERGGDPSPRHTVYRALCQLLRLAPAAERAAVLDELADRLGVGREGRPTHRTLTPDALRQMAGSGLVDIGAHTMTHGELAALSLEDQRREILDSRTVLQKITGASVTGFAYPFGGRAHYTPATVALVREAGFALACTTVPGRLGPATDPFQVPRVLVRDWDAERFGGRLGEWFGD